MPTSSEPFEVQDIYSHTAATVPANLHYSVMVGGEVSQCETQTLKQLCGVCMGVCIGGALFT